MNEEANTEVIRRCYEFYSSGDISGLMEFLSPDAAFSIPEVENSPYGGIWYGREGVEKFFELK
jgi:ketosteroid isomerase-like protein